MTSPKSQPSRGLISLVSICQDYIYGGAQADTLYGEFGDDHIYGAEASLVVVWRWQRDGRR